MNAHLFHTGFFWVKQWSRLNVFWHQRKASLQWTKISQSFQSYGLIGLFEMTWKKEIWKNIGELLANIIFCWFDQAYQPASKTAGNSMDRNRNRFRGLFKDGRKLQPHLLLKLLPGDLVT